MAGVDKLKVVYRKASSLIPYEGNARIHPPEQIQQIRASIKEFGFTNPILLKDDGKTVGAGHGRLEAALQEGLEKVPTITLEGLSDAQWRAYVIADNQIGLNASWDISKLNIEIHSLKDDGLNLDLLGFSLPTIEEILGGAPSGDQAAADQGKSGNGSLTDRFMVVPFSVLNAREGWWQDRKRAWIGIGIQSELGRGANALGFSETILANGKKPARTFGQDLMRGEHEVGTTTNGGVLMPSHTSGDPSFYAKKRAREAEIGRDLTTEEFLAEHYEASDAPTASGTSIFDPVLCEIAYRWFCPQGGTVLDPFAGGSVRGVVAAMLGREYHGVDLRPEQIEANKIQWADIASRKRTVLDGNGNMIEPNWTAGDSGVVLPDLDVSADLIFSCPPYGDLEVYSDQPGDISNMSDEAFLQCYRDIIAKSVQKLKPDRFACFVVGDYRDERGMYRDFVSRTIGAFRDAGMHLYNEIILVTSAGSLPIRAGKQFSSTRKVGKTHQNILVFVKGDPRKATEACGLVEISSDMFDDADQSSAETEEAPHIWGEQL